MKRKQAALLSVKQKQGGFLLAQLAVVVLIVSLISAYYGLRYAQESVRQTRDDKAQLVGNTLSTINDATKTYLTTYFTQIQLAQNVTANGYTVPPARVLTPTILDLSSLGLLPIRAVNPIIYSGQSIGFTVQIAIDKTSGCTVPTCNLISQVTTTTPLLDPSTKNLDIRRATIAATKASPGNAGVSMPTSMGGNPNIFVTSNGAQTGINASGVAGLISVGNGYDSSGFLMFDRRDGSLPRTGDINMQDFSGVKHNIRNAGNIDAEFTKTGTLQVTGLAVEGQKCSQLGLIATNTGGKLLGCNGVVWGKATDMPNAHRYVFTESTTWTVPEGVKSALVTMAGGGGSGLGWRFASQYVTGHSGGFVFSAPINLAAKETLTISVGRGGIAYGPVLIGAYWVPPPGGDDGLSGYPGGTSKIVSPTNGTLLECNGGSGATSNNYNSLSGDVLIPGPQGGAYAFGTPFAGTTPNRPAEGPYVTPNGPGACGINDYGLGNRGTSFYAMTQATPVNSGTYPGAKTPFGYGSGGSVGTSGCYVTPTVIGKCVWPDAGRPGVVMIDVLY